MLSHVFVGITDFDRAFAFYSGVMKALGLELKFSDPGVPWAGWKQPAADRPLFLIGHAYDGEPANPGNGQMIALLADSRDLVDLSYAAAMANGGSCEGQPGLRPHYHPHYYEGRTSVTRTATSLCVCCHRPE